MGESIGNQLGIDSLGLNLLHVILECSNRGSSVSEFSLEQGLQDQPKAAPPPIGAFEGDGNLGHCFYSYLLAFPIDFLSTPLLICN